MVAPSSITLHELARIGLVFDTLIPGIGPRIHGEWRICASSRSSYVNSRNIVICFGYGYNILNLGAIFASFIQFSSSWLLNSNAS